MTVLVCYAPTNEADDEAKETFYSALANELSKISPHDIVILLGDMNATVSDNHDLWRQVIGPVIPDPLNDNGLRLLQLCSMHNLVITNTLFARKDIHKYTWYSNDGRTKKMIDYIIVSQRWRSSISNCRTYRSAEIGNTDHRLVVANMRLRLQAQRSQPRPTKIDVSRLSDQEIRSKYAIDVSNRFDALLPFESSEDAWISFKKNVLESATANIGRAKRAKKAWVQFDTLDVIEQRRKARLLGDMPTYRRLNGVRNKLIQRDKKLFVERKANELEGAAMKGDVGSLYKHLRDLTSDKAPSVASVVSADGQPLSDEAAQVSRWKDHFSSLLNADAVAQTDQDHARLAASTQEVPSNEPETSFTTAEIHSALKRLKNNKAAGVCGVPAELLKYAGPAMLLWLQMLFSVVWRTEWVPKDWRLGIILPLWKRKGSKSICSNYRGITLLSVPGKLFAMTLLDRCTSILRRKRRVQQARFMPGRSTVEQIFTMRQLIEKTREFRRNAYVAFVDFKAAFDSVDRNSVWLILRSTGLPDKYCKLFEKLYEETESCVQVNGKRSTTFNIKTGVRQGCAAAPELFNCVIDYVMTRTTNRLPFGLQFGDRILTDADFADDLALVADSIDQLTDALEVLKEEAAKVGLKINWLKTKIMAIEPPGPVSHPDTITVCGTLVEVVKNFTYLGSVLSNDGSVDEEVCSRISKASSIVGRLNSLWRMPHISRRTKMRIYNASVSSVLLYAAETWPLKSTILKMIDVCQTKQLRRIEGFRWDDFVSNARLLTLTSQVPFSVQIAQRSLRWFGHLLRMPTSTPARIVYDFDPKAHGWSRPRGRPQTRWKDSLDKFLVMANIAVDEASHLAADRSAWRSQVAKLSTPHPMRQEP